MSAIPLLPYLPVKIAFIFSWQDSQYRDMGRGLYHHYPDFRAALDRYQEIIFPYSRYSQPYFVAFQLALTDLWRMLGIEPITSYGHGLGEIAAARCNHIISEEDALRISIFREEATSQLKGCGGIVECNAPQTTIESLLAQHENVYISIISGQTRIAVSGLHADLNAFTHTLTNHNIPYRRFPLKLPLYCPLMKPAATTLHNILNSMTNSRIDSAYWADQLCHPINFTSKLECLLAQHITHFLEVGNETILSHTIEQTVKNHPIGVQSLVTLEQGKCEDESFQHNFNQLKIQNVIRPCPMSVIEDQIKTIWKLVLRKDQLSLNDNFFAIGGNEKAALQILSKLKHLEMDISLELFFDHPTIKSLARVVNESCLIT